jgi:hypothetical protein
LWVVVTKGGDPGTGVKESRGGRERRRVGEGKCAEARPPTRRPDEVSAFGGRPRPATAGRALQRPAGSTKRTPIKNIGAHKAHRLKAGALGAEAHRLEACATKRAGRGRAKGEEPARAERCAGKPPTRRPDEVSAFGGRPRPAVAGRALQRNRGQVAGVEGRWRVAGGRDRVRRGRATRRCEGAEATGERQGLKERSQEWLRHQRPRAKRAGWPRSFGGLRHWWPRAYRSLGRGW